MVVLRLRVENIVSPPQEISIPREYTLRVKENHTLADVLHQIWLDSDQFQLRPELVLISDLEDDVLAPDHTIGELHIDPGPLELIMDIDFTIIHTSRRDPVEELFDVLIQWEDSTVHSLTFREPLSCTIATLKEYIAEDRNRGADDEPVDGRYFDLRYWSADEVVADDGLSLRDVMGLDVPPKEGELFELLFNLAPMDLEPVLAPSNSTSAVRFFINIHSQVPSLQNESRLFEVSTRTTLRQFINQITERADRHHVRRTFFDQVKLKYNNLLLSEFDKSLYELMDLSPDLLLQSPILDMDLVIHNHLSGVEGGILSRQFWSDLTSLERFQFLPNQDDLVPGAAPTTEVLAVEEDHTVTFEPTRIVMDNGVEWRLAGETYEIIEMDPRSVPANVTPGRLLVNQSDLSTVEYVFSMRYPGQSHDVKVSLNSSQCIVVDHPENGQYILLNPAGIARLDLAFRGMDGRSLIQQVKVHWFDFTDYRDYSRGSSPGSSPMTSAGTSPSPTSARDGATAARDRATAGTTWNGPVGAAPAARQGRRLSRLVGMLFGRYVRNLRNLDRRFFGSIIKYLILCFFIRVDQVILHYWPQLLAYALLFSAIHYTLFRPRRLEAFINGVVNDELYQEVLPTFVVQGLTVARDNLRLINGDRVFLRVKHTIVEYLKMVRFNEIDHMIRVQEGRDNVVYVVQRNVQNVAFYVALFFLSALPSRWISNQVQEFWRSDVYRITVYTATLNRHFAHLKEQCRDLELDSDTQQILEYQVPEIMLDLEQAEINPEVYGQALDLDQEQDQSQQDQSQEEPGQTHEEGQSQEGEDQTQDGEDDSRSDIERYHDQLQLSYQARLAVYLELRKMVKKLEIKKAGSSFAASTSDQTGIDPESREFPSTNQPSTTPPRSPNQPPIETLEEIPPATSTGTNNSNSGTIRNRNNG